MSTTTTTTTTTVPDIELEDLTTVALDGTGVFDELMKTVKLHVHDEWAEGRIKGADYATLYLGSIQAVLSQSVEFLLRRDLVAAQIKIAFADHELKKTENELKKTENDLRKEELEIRIAEKEFKRYELEQILPLKKAKLNAELQTQYVIRVGKDKEVAAQGLDNVVKDINPNPEDVYTPRYVETITVP